MAKALEVYKLTKQQRLLVTIVLEFWEYKYVTLWKLHGLEITW